MTIIDLEYNLEEQSTGFEPLPQGQYECRIESADDVYLGKSQAGKAKVVAKWSVVSGDQEGKKIVDHLPLHVGWRVKQYAEVIGLESGAKLDTKDFIGAEAYIQVDVDDSDEQNPRQNIKRITPIA